MKYKSKLFGTIIFLIFSLFFSGMAEADSNATQVFNHVKGSVAIVISADKTGKPLAQGSGVAVSSNLIVTNWHVVKNAATVFVSTKTKKKKAKILRASRKPDLALLRIDISSLGLKPIEFANEKNVIGQTVFAIGAPNGLAETLSEGIVSGLRNFTNYHYVQTTAAISPGSSGGALVNLQGKLLGITTFKFEVDGGLNFAIPAQYVSSLMLSNHNVIPEPEVASQNKGLLVSGKYIVKEKVERSNHSVELFDPRDIATSRNIIAYTSSSRYCGKIKGTEKNMCGLEFRSRKALDCFSQRTAILDIDVYNYSKGKLLKGTEPISLQDAEWKGWEPRDRNVYNEICGFATGKKSATQSLVRHHRYFLEKLPCDLLGIDEVFDSKLVMRDGAYKLKISLTKLGSTCRSNKQ